MTRVNFDFKVPEKIDTATVSAALELLGLDPAQVREVILTPRRMTVDLFTRTTPSASLTVDVPIR